ncbi:MAG: XdhC family protein [Pseudoruegeria sp.]
MTPTDYAPKDISDMARDMQTNGEAFAVATVTRTIGATSAKPGDKAILDAEGGILGGWIGGGCVRSAVGKATLRAMTEGRPQLVSLAPQEVLAEKGISAGDTVDGVRFARNGCPSEGSLDIFVEPVLPMPELCIYGQSPVALALGKLASQFQWMVRTCDQECPQTPLAAGGRRMIVVATQGKNDLASLSHALGAQAESVAFVGSARKWGALADKLRDQGVSNDEIARVDAPAGLFIHAVTPEEIALSILADLIKIRRQVHRLDEVEHG